MKLLALLTRHRTPILAVGLALLLACGAVLAVQVARVLPASDTITPADARGQSSSLQAVTARSSELLPDSDRDGLADVAENFVYGSNPHAFSTTGNGIPDGWLARYGYDPSEPGVESRAAAVPPADKLPKAYNGAWPTEYSWTLKDAYVVGRPADWSETTQGAWESGIDPGEWAAAEDAVPFAWLNHYGLDLRDETLAARSLTSDAFTIRDDYQANTDPEEADTDDDGLSDADEVRRYSTNPRAPSTSGTGIPDGWLVLYGLDAKDRRVGTLEPGRSGLTVSETWTYNLARYGRQTALGGTGLDPTKTSTTGAGIPDGWLVQHGLDPFEANVAEDLLQGSGQFAPLAERDAVAGADGQAPLPPVELRVRDAYAFARPDSWDEPVSGPWLGGLDPNRTDQDDDGLPDAVELRGWYARRTLGVGPEPRVEWFVASSDPRQRDTDGDTLTDFEEFMGRARRSANAYTFEPTDPRANDTAFSGMSDAEKVLGTWNGQQYALHETQADGSLRPVLDPSRTDTGKTYLADGAAMQLWARAAGSVGSAYTIRFPGSEHASYEAWIAKLPQFAGRVVTAQEARDVLAPDGDLNGDDVANVVDPDADSDRLLNGWEADPTLLRFSEFQSPTERAATDPANPDTDGDDLPDEWEIRHGLVDPAIPGWDLDPTKHDSDHDGDSDGKENLDNDVVEWFGFATPGQAASRIRNEFVFTNAQEFAAVTNPRIADENNDGVSEAWVTLWGQVYYSLVVDALANPASDAWETVGRLLPSEEQLDARRAQLENPLDDIGGVAKANVPYLRYAEVVGPAELLLDDRNDESFPDGWPREGVRVWRNDDVVERDLALIQGTYEHAWSRDASLGLNPYLLDTDGDGLPDAWETFFGRCIVGGVDPISPDALQDADEDGLTNLEEFSWPGQPPYSLGPCRADTDLGGLTDGLETEIRNDPTFPVDDANAGNGVRDTDGDGMDDREEILGGTSPILADTDSDGLLDGSDRTLRTWQVEQLPLIQDFQALGVAHRWLDENADGIDETVVFKGESLAGGLPLNPDTSADGIPDGWSAYYTGRADVRVRDEVVPRYACGRPAWWDETRLGVWWWGLTPAPGVCTRDMDLDGLDDRNGEDPVPAAGQRNLPALEHGELPTDLTARALTPREALLLGQGWGECAGNPQPCALQRQPLGGRAQVQFQDLAVHLAPLPDGTLRATKEQAFEITGRLVLACSTTPCAGVPRRTIVARIDQPDSFEHVLGVNFTDADGRFALHACVCAQNSTPLPQSGMVALTKDSGTTSWTLATQSLAVGTLHTLLLHAGATTLTFYDAPTPDATHPHYGDFTVGGQTFHATQGLAVTWPTQLRIASGTALTLRAPAKVPWNAEGREMTLSVNLRDVSGAPIQGKQVQLRIMNGATQVAAPEVTTNTQGAASKVIALPPDLVGTVDVSAQFRPPAAGDLGPSDATPEAVLLQAPLKVELIDPPQHVRMGQTITIHARATSRDEPVEDLPLQATLAGLAAAAETDEQGLAAFTFPLPTSITANSLPLTVRTQTSEAFVEAATTHTVRVLAASVLHVNVPENVSVGRHFQLDGRLVRQGGQGILDAPLVVKLGDDELGEIRTGLGGAFSAAINVPASVPGGPWPLVVDFEGIPGRIDGTSFTRVVNVHVTSVLQLSPVKGAKGGPVTIQGTLRDVAARPLAQQHIWILLDSALFLHANTTNDGGFIVSTTLPTNIALGNHTLLGRFLGNVSQHWGASSASANLFVGLGTRTEVTGPTILLRGNNSIVGRLRTVQDGPVPRAEVILQGSALSGSTLTDSDGVFRIPLLVPLSTPRGDLAFNVSFAGSAVHGPSWTHASLPLRVPTRIAAHLPHEMGRGSPVRFEFRLIDDAGVPVAAAPLHGTVLGEPFSLSTDDTGTAEFVREVPANATLGPTTIRAEFPGTPHLDASRLEATATVKGGVRIAFDQIPTTVRPGEIVDVGALVTDATGEPIVGETVSFRLDSDSVAYLARTDENGRASMSLAAPEDGTFGVLAFYAGTASLAAQSHESTPVVVEIPTAPAPFPTAAVAATAAAIVAMALIGLALWTRARSRRLAPLRKFIQESLGRIEAGDTWSASILLLHRRLTQYLEQLGFRERPYETVREYHRDLLRLVPLPMAAVVALANLFEGARYATQAVGPDQTLQARQQLYAIRLAIDEAVGARIASPSTREVAS